MSSIRTHSARLVRDHVITEQEVETGEQLEISFRRISIHAVSVSESSLKHRYAASLALYADDPTDANFEEVKRAVRDGAAFGESLLLQNIAHRSLVDFTNAHVFPWIAPIIQRAHAEQVKRAPHRNHSPKHWWSAAINALEALRKNCVPGAREAVSPETVLVRLCGALYAPEPNDAASPRSSRPRAAAKR